MSHLLQKKTCSRIAFSCMLRGCGAQLAKCPQDISDHVLRRDGPIPLIPAHRFPPLRPQGLLQMELLGTKKSIPDWLMLGRSASVCDAISAQAAGGGSDSHCVCTAAVPTLTCALILSLCSSWFPITNKPAVATVILSSKCCAECYPVLLRPYRTALSNPTRFVKKR